MQSRRYFQNNIEKTSRYEDSKMLFLLLHQVFDMYNVYLVQKCNSPASQATPSNLMEMEVSI